MSYHKVVGYVSIDKSRGLVFCDEDACVIAGSEESMESYIEASGLKSSGTIKKARYGEVKQGIILGGKYLFDKDSWSRFKEIGERDRFFNEGSNSDEEVENKFGGKMILVYRCS